MNSPQLTFLGAAGTVTGSAYLLEGEENKFIIDQGLFQGPDVFKQNYDELEFNPEEITAVFVTHGHIDHSGLLPKLIKEGYTGPIYSTIPTYHIISHLLVDSAKVQEKNEKFRHVPAIYQMNDSLKAISQIKPIKFNQSISIEGTKFTFRRSSHILGAASLEVSILQKNICFSGDLGRRNPTIIQGYSDFSKEQDYVVMESLYGERDHITREDALRNLLTEIKSTLARNGNVIIPVFALHRSQEVLFFLQEFIKIGALDKDVQIFFDTPLGNNMLKLYTEYSNHHSDEFKAIKDPFGLQSSNLHIIRDYKESTALRRKKGVIIVAGGGMLDGGRAVTHLFSNIHDKNSSVIIVGFQAEGTRGRTLISNPDTIQNFKGKPVKLDIRVKEIYGFSAHGDRSDLLWWVNRFEKDSLNTVFLTHAEPAQSSAFSEELGKQGYNVEVPKQSETYILD